MAKEQKWFHAIGVSGKATANIAKMFKDMGWFVTGSDAQFFPPASTLLEKEKINTVEGFDYRHLTKEFWEEKLKIPNSKFQIPNYPDLVLFISHLSNKNKEYLFAKKKGLDIRPFSRILKEYLIKDESVVVVGTAGKTTTTALITFLFQKLGLNPSYMIGADVVDIPDSLQNTDSEFSVIEGDEYHNPDPEIEGKAKFLEFKPKYLVITKITWDHADIFPTEERYIEEFKKVVSLVPEDGLIIAKDGERNIDEVVRWARCPVIRYTILKTQNSKPKTQKSRVWSVHRSVDSTAYSIYDHNGRFVLDFETSLLGDYNLENILAAVILVCNIPAHLLPIDLVEQGTATLKNISKYISEFHGAKKRLEFLYQSEDLAIVDDFGVTAERVGNSLKTLKENFPKHKIIGIYEPNAGSRPKDKKVFKKMYETSFKDADEVIIPELSDANQELAMAEDFVTNLKELDVAVEHVKNEELVEELRTKVKKIKGKILVVFFSSYRLTEAAEKLANSYK